MAKVYIYIMWDLTSNVKLSMTSAFLKDSLHGLGEDSYAGPFSGTEGCMQQLRVLGC